MVVVVVVVAVVVVVVVVLVVVLVVVVCVGGEACVRLVGAVELVQVAGVKEAGAVVVVVALDCVH